MCSSCHNPFCHGGCQNNWPQWNPPYTQPVVNFPFGRVCQPPVPPVLAHPCKPCNPCLQVGCVVTITTACVLSSVILPCLNFGINTSLNQILLAIDTKLCQLAQGQPCPTWTDVTFLNSWANQTGDSQHTQYSTVKDCTVRLRGTATKIIDDNCTSEAIFTLPLGRRPLGIRVFPIAVLYGGSAYASDCDPQVCEPISDCGVTPGVVIIGIDGTVTAVFSAHNASGTVNISFDGIFFETT